MGYQAGTGIAKRLNGASEGEAACCQRGGKGGVWSVLFCVAPVALLLTAAVRSQKVPMDSTVRLLYLLYCTEYAHQS